MIMEVDVADERWKRDKRIFVGEKRVEYGRFFFAAASPQDKLMPLNVILGELVDYEIVESALKCLKKALPLTFLIVDLPLLLPRIVSRYLQQTLNIPQEGLSTRDRGILATLYRDCCRRYLRVIQCLGTLRSWRW